VLPRGAAVDGHAAGDDFAPLDLGGDKIPGKKLDREVNPAMGLRAIRYCLAHRELFRIQLRALLRASAHGNSAHHVPPGVGSVGAARGAQRAGALPQRAGPRGRAGGQPPHSSRHHGGDAVGGDHRRPAGARGPTSFPSAPTTSFNTRSPSTGRTGRSPTSTGRSTWRCCARCRASSTARSRPRFRSRCAARWPATPAYTLVLLGLGLEETVD